MIHITKLLTPFTMEAQSSYRGPFKFCTYRCFGKERGSVKDVNDISYLRVYQPLYAQLQAGRLPRGGRYLCIS